jgi:hypothetical protein
MIDWAVKAGLVESKNVSANRIVPAIHYAEMRMVVSDELKHVSIGSDHEGEIIKHWKGENNKDKACNMFEKYLEQAKDKLDCTNLLFAIAHLRMGLCDTEEFKDEPRKTLTLEASIKTFKQIVDEDPFYAPWAEIGIVQCLVRLGKKTEAFAALDNILAKWPTYERVVRETKEYIEHPDTARLTPSFEPSGPIPVKNDAPLPPISKPYNISMSVTGGVLVLILLSVRLRSWRKARSTRQN